MTPPESTPPRRLPLWKQTAFSLALIATLLLVGEVAAHIGLRVTRGFDGKHLYQYQYDPYKNILPTPNYVDTRGIEHNSVGFRRSSEVAPLKPPNTIRIFLMGGSTAYGLGGLWPHVDASHRVLRNEETIDAFLEELLSERFPDAGFEVVNAAITSTWTHHELIYLNQTVLRYNPDVVLFLDGFNDFFFTEPDHDQFATYSYNMPARVIMGDPSVFSLGYANAWWLFRKSALAHVAGRGLRLVKLLLTRDPNRQPIDVSRRLEGLRNTFPRNALTMHRRIGIILEDEGIDAVFMLQPLLILERDRQGMPPIERELFDFNVESYRPNHEEFMHFAVDFVRRLESEMADDVGGTFIDLTGAFAGIEDQVYTDYAHLTPAGNRIVAEVVLERLVPILESRTAVQRRH